MQKQLSYHAKQLMVTLVCGRQAASHCFPRIVRDQSNNNNDASGRVNADPWKVPSQVPETDIRELDTVMTMMCIPALHKLAPYQSIVIGIILAARSHQVYGASAQLTIKDNMVVLRNFTRSAKIIWSNFELHMAQASKQD